jgi:asparagine synthase (glutamine-hydrolysing)
MPGIYGYIKQKKEDDQLIQMTEKLYHHKHFVKDDDFNDDIFQASHLHLGKMKKDINAFNKDGIYISIEGEQYDYKNVAFEGLIYEAYTQDNLETFLNKLDGYFNAVIYDSNIKKVFLISDRYGMRMLYYYCKDGRFAFSGEVKGLLGLDFVDGSIESKQIDCFMDLGYFLEDNTWHKHVKLIKPATIMEFDIDSKTLAQKYYWKWSEIKPQNISFDEAVNKLGKLFLSAVEKRFNPNDKVGVALSGGLDSRAIFAAVNKLYPSFKGYTYTFGIPNCDDITIAKQCIAKTNWKHEEFYFRSGNWFEPRKDKVWFTDGMMPLMHMHGSEFLDEIGGSIDFNLNGYAGDVVLGGGWLSSISLDARASKSNLLKFYKSYINLCNIEDSFYDIQKFEPHLYINKVRRFTNMGTVNGLYKIDQRKPFFDNKVMELVYSIPDEYRENNKLYSAMLLKFFPKFFKDIPWQKTGKTIDKNTSNGFASEVIRKIKRIPYKVGILKDKNSYTSYKDWIRSENISRELLSLLDRNKSEYGKYTDIDFKTKYLLPHLRVRMDFSEQILRATTIEIYFKNLVGDGAAYTRKSNFK